MDLETVTIGGPEDEELLDAFHAGLYLEAFAHQREPVEVWKRRRWGPAPPYALTIRLCGRALRDPARRELAGGIAFERYPRSGCGLMTYLVIGEAWRGGGLGRRLLDEAVAALTAAGAPCVLGEVSAPDDDASRARLARFQRWGARVIDLPYVQPALGPGLTRDRHLWLLAFGAAPGPLRGDVLRDFLAELFAITEGAAPEDAEAVAMLAGIPPAVPLVELPGPGRGA